MSTNEILKKVKENISKKDYTEAIKNLESIKEGKNVNKWIYLGFCYHKMKDFDKSEKSYLKSLELQEKKEGYIGLYELYNEMKIENKKIEMLKKLKEDEKYLEILIENTKELKELKELIENKKKEMITKMKRKGHENIEELIELKDGIYPMDISEYYYEKNEKYYQELKENHPNSKIILLKEKKYLQLLHSYPYLSESNIYLGKELKNEYLIENGIEISKDFLDGNIWIIEYYLEKELKKKALNYLEKIEKNELLKGYESLLKNQEIEYYYHLFPNNNYFKNQFGYQLYKKKQYKESLNYIQNIYKKSKIYFLLKDYNKSLELLNQIELKNSKEFYLKYLLTKDISYLKKSFQMNPNKYGLELSYYYIELKDYKLVESIYKKMNNFESQKRLAFYYLYHHQYNDSLLYFQNLIKSNSNISILWEGLGDVYKKQGKLLSALKCFQKSYQLDSSREYSYIESIQLSKLLLDDINIEIKEFKSDYFYYKMNQLENIQNKNEFYFKELGDREYKNKNYKKSSIYYLSLLHLNPSISFIWKDLGHITKNRNEFENSHLLGNDSLNEIGYYQNSLEISQHCFIEKKSYDYLGYLYLKEKDYELSYYSFKKMIEIQPFHYLSWMGLGIIYDLLNKRELSEYYHQQSISIQENDISLISLSYSNDILSSFHYLTKYLIHHSLDSIAWNQMGILLEKLKKYQESKLSYLKSYSLNKDKNVLYNLMRIYYYLKDYQSAYDLNLLDSPFYPFISFHLNKKLDKIQNINLLAKIKYYQNQIQDSIQLLKKSKDLNDIYTLSCITDSNDLLLNYLDQDSLLLKIYLEKDLKKKKLFILKAIHLYPNQSIFWNEFIYLRDLSKLDLDSLYYQITDIYMKSFLNYSIGYHKNDHTKDLIKKSIIGCQKLLIQNPLNDKFRKLLKYSISIYSHLMNQHSYYLNLYQNDDYNMNDIIMTCEHLMYSGQYLDCLNLIKKEMKNDNELKALLVKCLYLKNDSKYLNISLNDTEFNNKILIDIFIHEKRYDLSIELLKKYPKFILILNDLYLKTNQLNLFNSSLNQDSSLYYYLLGKFYYLKKDLKNSKISFQKSISLFHSNLLSNISLYPIHYQSQDWENAENDLWFEKDLIPTHSFIYFLLSQFALESNQSQPSKIMIQKAIHYQPNQSDYWNYLKKNFKK